MFCDLNRTDLARDRNQLHMLKTSHTKSRWAIAAALLALSTSKGHAPSHSVDWYKIAGGAGTSTGGIFQVSGTVGQTDANVGLSGGGYSLTGGFASIISVQQTTGLPNLSICHSGNSIIVSWPNNNQCRLLQTADLAGGNWTTSLYSITTVNGTNSITLNSPAGNLFFRLISP